MDKEVLKNIEEIRKNYQRNSLDESHLTDDPIDLFSRWWDEALAFEIVEPNAMTLATVNKEGHPTARIVLLKGFSKDGFEFYTNYQSHKAQDMGENPHVALVFLWKEIERQIRIEGVVEKLSNEKSQAYFQTRPRGSQIGAWASPQSNVIPDRKVLEDEADKIAEKFENVDPLPLPDHWGGYLVRHHLVEFWQGRTDRLHDRFRYQKEYETWIIERLAP